MLINVLVAGWLVDELLVTALHGDVPHVVPDVLRPAVRGPVDVVLGVAHDAEKSADDAQRQHGLQPVEPHREPDGETADGDGQQNGIVECYFSASHKILDYRDGSFKENKWNGIVRDSLNNIICVTIVTNSSGQQNIFLCLQLSMQQDHP